MKSLILAVSLILIATLSFSADIVKDPEEIPVVQATKRVLLIKRTQEARVTRGQSSAGDVIDIRDYDDYIINGVSQTELDSYIIKEANLTDAEVKSYLEPVIEYIKVEEIFDIPVGTDDAYIVELEADPEFNNVSIISSYTADNNTQIKVSYDKAVEVRNRKINFNVETVEDATTTEELKNEAVTKTISFIVPVSK